MDKGNCDNCGLKIQKTTHDKCMYCGTSLNPEQIFTDEEKAEIIREKEELKQQLQAAEVEGKGKKKKSSGFPDIDSFDYGSCDGYGGE